VKKYILTKIWLLRYAIEFKRRTKWPFKECYSYGESSLENFDYDLEECPIEMVGEDISCWSD